MKELNFFHFYRGASGLERWLHDELSKNDSSLQVADALLREWQNGKLSWMDQECAARFLLNAGFDQALIEQICRNLKNEDPLPWNSLAEILSRHVSTLNEEQVDYLLVGASEEDSLYQFVCTQGLEKLSTKFQKVRLRLLNDHLSTSSFSTSTGSQNQKLKPLTAEEIRKLLQNKFQSHDQDIINSFQDLARSNPMLRYDLAIQLKLMDKPLEALTVLEEAIESEAKDWLKLELLIDAQKYLEALQFIEALEEQYSSQKEAIETCAYYRALCSYQLGQKAYALQLLKDLLTHSPEHHNASVLLSEWEKET